MKYKQINLQPTMIRLHPYVLARLQLRAKSEDSTMALIIRQLVDRYLEEVEVEENV